MVCNLTTLRSYFFACRIVKTAAKWIGLNLELAKKLPECLEYILVHELVHLLVRKHDQTFHAHMDKQLSNWLEIRDLLNKMPLAFY